jgi:hypothetical protein
MRGRSNISENEKKKAEGRKRRQKTKNLIKRRNAEEVKEESFMNRMKN